MLYEVITQFTLVDPDNRQPIDFSQRYTMLKDLQQCFDTPSAQWVEQLKPLVAQMDDGRIKLYLIWRTLALRQRWTDVFDEGEYLPLTIEGPAKENLFSYNFV